MKTILPVMVGVGLVLACAGAAARAEDSAQKKIKLAIQSETLADALAQWADQTDLQLISMVEQTRVLTAPLIRGTFTPQAALDRLLANTPLTSTWINDRTVAIRERVPSTALEVDGRMSATGAVAQLNGDEMPSARGTDSDQEADRKVTRGPTSGGNGSDPERDELEEVVVTGTHIRGVKSASPIITLDRVAIEQTGYSSVQQLVQSLPQNFSSISDTTFGTINGGSPESIAQGSAVNLRGLGGASTLVLLNGRRLAASGDGGFVDLSLVPLTAVERIDVLTDGASATYGSDAIGGVVNIILRKEFEGAETTAKYGTVTSGDSDEFQFGQALGGAWDRGHGLVSYEYLRRSPLSAKDRSFTQNAPGVLDLSPKQERHSVVATFAQGVTEGTELFGDFLYGKREAHREQSVLGTLNRQASSVDQVNGTAGVNTDLGGNWLLTVSGMYGQSHTRQESVEITGDSSLFEYASRLWSVDATADGPLARAPGGDIRLAVGVQYRDEQLEPKAFTGIRAHNTLGRDVSVGFAELLLPLVGADNHRRGVERLALSAAGRYERYSDFGSTTNPKFGVSWTPLHGLDVRATYGTSFRAPLLSQLNPVNLLPIAFDMPDPTAATEVTPSILLFGSGENLGPEEATTWTAGFDFVPSSDVGFAGSLTYFEIRFTDRVATPIPDDDRLFTALFEPTYAAFVQRNPDSAAVEELFADPGFLNASSATLPSEIGAIVDDRLVNLVEQNLSGIDLSLSYRIPTTSGLVGAQLAGNYLLDGTRRVLPGTPELDTLNSVFEPVDLRLRASVSWQGRSFSAIAFVNYTDGYRDDRLPDNAGPDQRARVESWTTVDCTLRYAPAMAAGGLSWLSGTDISFSALNIFDRDPPFVASQINVNFDGANATPIGRTVSLTVRKRW